MAQSHLLYLSLSGLQELTYYPDMQTAVVPVSTSSDIPVLPAKDCYQK